ncbi:nitrogen permease regulator 2-domain-containing protein [Cyathus striatus]|nr:nitrogen permease regulator 2-domain-containing protein [Cyathus striatus]
MPDGDSFLPRIQSVFYAIFDIRQGPKIVYQVPEGLIAVPPPGPAASIPPTPASETPPSAPLSPLNYYHSGSASRNSNSSSSLVSPTSELYRSGRSLPSPQKRSISSQRTLFNFDDISKYVIPPSAFCGRLVTCSTRRHRIIGFPAELKGPGKYERNYFRYNLCFVFDRGADLSCYEPIVRKIARVFTSCEEESGFLSSSQTSPAIHAILEQLYEDLNSYSETSIPIDQFNSIELKIFPFYPNPPPVKDWMVPLALINLTKRIEDNWDLTMAKVVKYIDGTNHVSRIAHLADCDIGLTRQAISHLLYYQVIMTIDIFQYSNMYTLRKSVRWLADETHVKEECGPYVTKTGRHVPDWPKLLHLYSRLKPGKTIYEWMEEYDVDNLGIDPRRFTSFGVIKGFLRRIHRYPVYTPAPSQFQGTLLSYNIATPHYDFTPASTARPRGKSLSGPSMHFPTYDSPSAVDGRPSISPDLTSSDSPAPSAVIVNISATHRARRASAAEKILEQLRSRDIQKSGTSIVSSPRTSWIHHQKDGNSQGVTTPGASGGPSTAVATPGRTISNSGAIKKYLSQVDSPTKAPVIRRHSLIGVQAIPSPVMSKATLATPTRPRSTRSPSTPYIQQQHHGAGTLTYPPELIPLLDGEHHTDELSVKFEAGWPLLEQWLVIVGGGATEDDKFGKVSIIYR